MDWILKDIRSNANELAKNCGGKLAFSKNDYRTSKAAKGVEMKLYQLLILIAFVGAIYFVGNIIYIKWLVALVSEVLK